MPSGEHSRDGNCSASPTIERHETRCDASRSPAHRAPALTTDRSCTTWFHGHGWWHRSRGDSVTRGGCYRHRSTQVHPRYALPGGGSRAMHLNWSRWSAGPHQHPDPVVDLAAGSGRILGRLRRAAVTCGFLRRALELGRGAYRSSLSSGHGELGHAVRFCGDGVGHCAESETVRTAVVA